MSCELLPQLPAGPQRPRLDRAGWDAEQDGRFGGGEAVDDGGLHDGAQLRGEPRQRTGKVAVLDAEQDVFLGGRLVPAADPGEHPAEPAVGAVAAQRVDEPPGTDPPQPAGDVTAVA